MTTRAYGSKALATQDLYGKDLNKAITKSVNAKMPDGIRVTLRSTGGHGLKATIKGCLEIWNPERVRLEQLAAAGNKEAEREVADYYWLNQNHPRYAPEADLLIKFVEREIEAFNYDGSDSQSDYFDVRFYLSVEFNGAEAEAQKIAIIDAGSPTRATRRQLLGSAWAVANDWLAEHGCNVMSAWQANEVRTMRAGLIKALGAEFVTKLDEQVNALDRQLAEGDDWAPAAVH